MRLLRDHLECADSLSALDLGCGQGRLSLALAREIPASSVIGYDISPSAIAFARQATQSAGIEAAEFIVGDIESALQLQQGKKFDVILFTEVAIFLPHWRTLLPKIRALLRPGGLFLISVRSRYFNVLHCLDRGYYDAIPMLIEASSGRFLPGTAVDFSWCNSEELVREISSCEMDTLTVSGIGVCSGIPGDPHASIARPDLLPAEWRSTLMQAETALAELVPDAGRYIAVVARAT